MTIKLDSLCPLLQVFDMPRSLRFYCDVLGFSVVQAAPSLEQCDWCWLRKDDVHLMLNTQFESCQRPTTSLPARDAHHGDTILFFACQDLDAAYIELKQTGIALEPPVIREYGMRQLPFTDPDGYGLCLQWPVNS